MICVELTPNSVFAAAPHLMNEWDELNNAVSDKQRATRGSTTSFWWRCLNGHSWKATPSSRLRGSGCPYCSGKRPVPGKTDLATTDPIVASMWSPLNPDDPSIYLRKSSKTKLWVCPQGHSWSMSIANMTRANGSCPVCTNRHVVYGVNDFASQHPSHLELWDAPSNGVHPHEIAAASRIEVWWRCTQGHSWKRSPYNQIHATNPCPVCAARTVAQVPALMERWDDPADPRTTLIASGAHAWWKCAKGHRYHALIPRNGKPPGCVQCRATRIVPGVNDIATTHPHLAVEWSSDNQLCPQDVSRGDKRLVMWVCGVGHKWSASINARALQNQKCPICSGKKVLAGFNDLASNYPDLASQWHPDNNKSPHEVTCGSKYRAKWTCGKHTWTTYVHLRTGAQSTGCPQCASPSAAETEIAEYIESILDGRCVIRNARSVIPPMELDVYIPSMKIAVEFNGLYWHSESNGKERMYHHQKWNAAQANGVQLIQVWEDDWRDRCDIVKRMLAHKMYVSALPSVGARTCEVVKISPSESREFLNDNHIQGFSSGSVHLSLTRENGDNVAVMTLRKDKNVYYMDRYATSVRVVGGFSKMLRYAESYVKDNGGDQIITFSDNSVSDGKLYSENGFYKDMELKPDYSYIVGRSRAHKFGYRLKRFRNDPKLKYREGMSERQLAELNNLHRVWDSGKVRWVKSL